MSADDRPAEDVWHVYHFTRAGNSFTFEMTPVRFGDDIYTEVRHYLDPFSLQWDWITWRKHPPRMMA